MLVTSQVIIADQEQEDLEDLGQALVDYTDSLSQFGTVVSDSQAEHTKTLQAASAAFAEAAHNRLEEFRRDAPYTKQVAVCCFA